MEKNKAEPTGLHDISREECKDRSVKTVKDQEEAKINEFFSIGHKEECTLCERYINAREVASALNLQDLRSYNNMPGIGSETPDVVVVVPDSRFIGGFQEFLKSLYTVVPQEKVRIIAALRCKSRLKVSTLEPEIKTQVNACRDFVQEEIDLYNPKVVLLLGPVALYSALKKSDKHYTKYFGSVMQKKGRFYICTHDNMQHFRREITTHLSKIPYLLKGGVESDNTLKTKILMTHKEVNDVIDYLENSGLPFVFDIETGTNIDSEVSGFGPDDKLLGIGLSWSQTKGVFIPVDHKDSPFKDDFIIRERLKKLLVQGNPKCAHNAMYDIGGTEHFLDGIRVHNVVFDTMLAHHVIDPTKGTHSLKYLVTQFTDLGGYEEKVKEFFEKLPKDERSYGKLDLDTLGIYCIYDCIGTYILWDLFDEFLNKHDSMRKIFEEITFPCTELMLDLKKNPWIVDEQKLEYLKAYYDNAHKKLDQFIQSFVKLRSTKHSNGMNIKSPKQLSEFITTDLKLEITTKTKKGTDSTAKDAIETLKNQVLRKAVRTTEDTAVIEFFDKLLQFRACEKIKSTYIEGLSKHIRDGKIYTEYLVEGTETARLSSRKPNMQNIHGSSLDGSKESSVKSIFVAPKNHKFLIADYSQIELRNLANCTEDETLMNTFINGIHNHKATAAMLFSREPSDIIKDTSPYKVGKMVNFGVVYGMGPKKMGMELEKMGLTYEELETLAYNVGYKIPKDGMVLQDLGFAIINKLYEGWPTVKSWQWKMKNFAKKHKAVLTPFGRIRRLREWLPGGMKVNIMNIAVNTPVQSVSSDCLLLALIAIHKTFKERKFKSYIVGTVHDSGIFYVHDDELDEVTRVIKECMEQAPLEFKPEFFRVPLVVEFEIGDNWAVTEPYVIP